MKRGVLCKLTSFLFCLQLQASKIPYFELYSEGIYSSTSSTLGNLLFARAFLPVSENLSPYIQLGSQQSVGNLSQDDFFLSPGLVWNQKYFKAFGEHRLHSHPFLGPQKSEWRILLASGIKEYSPLGTWSHWYLFFEPYTEALLSLSGKEYFSLTGLVRLGVERSFTETSGIDFYLEPFLSQNNQFQENYTSIQLRPSVRWRSCEASLCLSFILANLISLNERQVPDFLFVGSIGGAL